MSAGYTYTTLTGNRDQPIRVQVAFHLDDSAWLTVPGESARPHLLISQGGVSAIVSPAQPGKITAEDAQTARKLADVTARYADAIERLADDGIGPVAA